ncbi:MAG: FAD-binding protein, partial [Chitinophagaceae bacterium]|nr:FAD-binding protein [Chitinophagaceae bacterium]
MAYDVIIIGSGQGGYPAAIRASHPGVKVEIIEKKSMGGLGLNWGRFLT